MPRVLFANLSIRLPISIAECCAANIPVGSLEIELELDFAKR